MVRNILFALSQFAGMQVVIALAGIIRNKILALRLGPGGVGEFSQLAITAATVYVIVNFGLGFALSRNVAASKTIEERQKHLSVANFMVICLSIMFWLVIAFVFWRGAYLLPQIGLNNNTFNILALTLLILLAPIEAMRNNYYVFLQGILDVKGMTTGRSLGMIIGTIASVPIVWFYGMLGAVIQTMLISCILAIILGKRCSKVGYKPLKLQWNWGGVFLLGSMGFASLLNGFAQNISDVFIRSELIKQLSLSHNGLYQCALTLSAQVKSVVLGGVGGYSLAFISQQENIDKMSNSVNQLLRTVLPLGALALSLLGIFSYYFIYLLYSPSFASATQLFPILLGADYLQVFVWVITAPLLARGLIGYWLIVDVIYAIVRWFGVYLLLPRIGAQAVVFGYFIAVVIQLVLYVYINNKIIKLKLLPSGFRNLIMGLILIITLSWFGCVSYRAVWFYIISLSLLFSYTILKLKQESGGRSFKQIASYITNKPHDNLH